MQSKLLYNRKYLCLFFIILYLITNTLLAQQVKLTWIPGEYQNTSHYNIYRSTDLNANFTLIGNVVHPDNVFTDETVNWNMRYYYVATTVDDVGNESGFSNMIDTTLSLPTPVEFCSFSVCQNHNSVILEWSTATESNNFGFDIQRCSDEKTTFDNIGFVKGNNTTNEPHYYKYIDEHLNNGTYYYRLKQVDYNGEYHYSGTSMISIKVPGEFSLSQNYPNPFNASTSISYNLPLNSHVKLIIYDINGKEVYQIVDKFQEANQYNFTWDATNFQGKAVSTGLYFYKIQTRYFTESKRMIVLK